MSGNKIEEMLELSNLQFQASSKLFTKQSRKLIRISYKNSIITSRNICTFVNEATIRWDETLRIPEVYNQSIDFEIYNEHEFGYNPEEMHNLLYGSIRLTQNKSIGKFEVSAASDVDKKMGFLLFDVKKVVKKSGQEGNSESKVTKTLVSILVRNLIEPQESGYIVVNNGKYNFKSQLVEAIKGEFFYSMIFKNEKHIIKSTDPKDKILVSFHNESGKTIGIAQYFFRTDKKHEIEDIKVGEIYFQIQIEDKNQSSKKQAPEPEVTKQKVELHHEPKADKSNVSQYRSMSLSRLTSMGQSQFIGTIRHKKMSVIHNNGDVVFPSEKRFMSYQDKQTNIISYSKLPSMKFEEEHSRKYYKGASIGVGSKSDFTAYYRHNPGVGQYKLPSIFDRY